MKALLYRTSNSDNKCQVKLHSFNREMCFMKIKILNFRWKVEGNLLNFNLFAVWYNLHLRSCNVDSANKCILHLRELTMSENHVNHRTEQLTSMEELQIQ